MANKPLTIRCDAGCRKEFTFSKIRTRKVKDGIEKNYFTCPHCKHEYITYYVSAETLKLQKNMRKLHVEMRDTYGTEEGIAFLVLEAKLKETIKQSMDDARAIAEGI